MQNNLSGNQISPLPIGPGGNNSIKTQLNDLNAKLTMMSAQSVENAKFDPPAPKPATKPMIVEKFCSHSVPSTLAVVGILVFAYGIFSK
uniref:Uncharacterized protein n=1 Tax=viral metagenome TaxID=1070528 RepID=A0A6C0KLY4_9ZZZZ